MNSNTDFQLSNSFPAEIWRELGADLVFIQDASGKYLSFYWQQSESYDLGADLVVGSQMGETFGPALLEPYLERIHRVLENSIPERFSYPFVYQDHYIPLELVVSPILTPNSKPSRVMVMGRTLEQNEMNSEANLDEIIAYRSLPSNFDIQQKMLVQIAGTICRTVPPSSQIYQTLLSQITQKIRRTLDLKQIWQQTVASLGQVLRVNRCIICPYKPDQTHTDIRFAHTQVVAEYLQNPYESMLGSEISISHEWGWSQALATLEPIALERTSASEDSYKRHSVLVVATSYLDQPNGVIRPNGLIALHQCDRFRQWTLAEIDFVRELATHVGTAIAHATLYQELEEARAEAEASSRLKSEFLANTSHELRTPLNGIIGFLKLVIDGMVDDPEEEREFVQEGHRAALHLLNLINDVLDIAKIEAGKMEIDLALVKVSELLKEVEQFTKTQVQQKGLNLSIHEHSYSPDLIVYANYQRLLQVMLNLVGNAIKFTHEGGVNISLGVLNQKVILQNQEFPGFVEFRVTDTGIGVPLEKQDRLFKAFSQVDTGYTRQYGGTGLGLVISQKLVQAMGGSVKFYSLGEGLGSTVTFTVPLYQEPRQNNAENNNIFLDNTPNSIS
ncbi:GAF domain-containing protein [Lyngbya sp. PCC 8106]|uniref:GAF domain-containing protein n=1 Tax=Lyngbya sp. (strain PCC 8106) TaxID=313612 RepID=UPI0000EAA435|nr:GAF domain-containing protein [Lyngbya sp. PCC 8106]EAW37757.1 GAF Sensor Signal Transduction Histidine Kinase [Lyngbya sp. PCC 8106]